jgi:acyl-CoA synthetase (AMP-forming)/AMP-acid ligase II
MASVSDHAPANLFELLERLARDEPGRLALLAPSRRALTCRELAEAASRLAASFVAGGLRRGDRVLVMAPPCAELYLTLLALMKLAATAVFVEPALGLGHLLRCARAARPKAFVGTRKARLLLRASGVLRDVPLVFPVETLPSEDAPPVATTPAGDETPALITYTSGTAGASKATSRTHRLLWAQHRALAGDFAYRKGDRVLTALPLFALHDLAAGAGVVLPALRREAALEPDPARVVCQIEEHDVTLVRGGPRFCAELARFCSTRGILLPRVRALFTGGAPIAAELVETLRRLLPSGEVYVVYGSTEAEPIAAAGGRELARARSLTVRGFGVCVGKPVGDVRVRIVVPKGQAIGEIAVAGDHVNHGGWHRTGDTGRLDERGRLWLTGRVAGTVVRAGKALHPLQVEPVVDELPFVERCALLGVSDPELGERAALIVAPRRNGILTRALRSRAWRTDIERSCRSIGVDVDEIAFARALPLDRRHRAKIRYDRLRAWYERPALVRAVT